MLGKTGMHIKFLYQVHVFMTFRFGRFSDLMIRLANNVEYLQLSLYGFKELLLPLLKTKFNHLHSLTGFKVQLDPYCTHNAGVFISHMLEKEEVCSVVKKNCQAG